MPELDGIRLIQELINRGEIIPCIVMTAFGTRELESRVLQLGGIGFVNKPVELDTLKASVREALDERRETSVVRGLGLASFLQLLATERKSCTVAVKTPAGGGLVFMRDGILLDAIRGDKSGAEAAQELLCSEKVEIALRNGCRRRTRAVEAELQELLIESFRRRDEQARDAPPTAGAENDGSRKETKMALETYLEEFRGVKGYIASGILDAAGEVLASDSASPKVDLAAVGAVFNDIFRSAHEASSKIGLDACRTMVLNTPRGVVVMECSGADAARHLHMIAVLEEGGNQALAKMTIGKALPKAVAELT